MSLMNSLATGVSGLRGFQTKMDVIGNNIANVNTTGFKAGRVSFAEMMNLNLTRGGNRLSDSPQFTNQLGLGVRVSSIDRDLNQGSLETTNRPTDLAIQGGGYFLVGDGTQNYLTRAGNFSFNKDGFLVTQEGFRVQGYNGDGEGNIVAGGATSDLRINFQDIFRPQATQNVNLAGNLNSGGASSQVVTQTVPFTVSGGALASGDTLLDQISQFSGVADGEHIRFTITNADGSTSEVAFPFEARVIDDTDPDNPVVVQEGSTLNDFVNFISEQAADGTAQLRDGIIVLNSDRIGASELSIGGFQIVDPNDADAEPRSVNQLDFRVTTQGADNTKTLSSTVYDGLGKPHTLIVEFTQQEDGMWTYSARILDGAEIGTGQVEFDADGKLISSTFDELTFNPGNGAAPVTFNLNFAADGRSLTQFDGSSTANAVSQDGYAQGELVDFFVDVDGFLVGSYSNGKSKNMGQLALANVPNPEGLQNLGSGLLRLNDRAGDLSLEIASNMSGTNITSGALESSNVDLAKEFTDMIITQRAYQSNARVIQTADQILAEAVNLKR